MATKLEQALELAKLNPSFDGKQLQALFVEKLGMTELGARTYSYNVRKQLSTPGATPTPRVKGERKAVAKRANAAVTGGSVEFGTWANLSKPVGYFKPAFVETLKNGKVIKRTGAAA